MVAHSSTRFAKAVDRSYGNDFGNSEKSMSGKIGKQLQIRLPNKYSIRSGSTMQVQAHQEQSTAIVIGTQYGIDTEMSDFETATLVDEYERRCAEPMGKTIASAVDADLASMYTLIAQSVLIDTTSAVTQTQTILQGKQKIVEANVPLDDELSLIMGASAEPKLVPNYTNVYNPQGDISKMFREGRMSTAHSLNWYLDQEMPIHTCGTRIAGSGTTIGATVTAQGVSSLTLKNSSNQTVKVGDVFSIGSAGANPVYSVKPETKKSTGSLAQFVVQPAASGTAGYTQSDANDVTTGYYTLSAGGVVVYIDRPIYTSTSAGLQNVDSLPQNTAVCTFVGAASTAYAQLIGLHKTAAAAAMVKLPLYNGLGTIKRADYDGMSLRYWKGPDITNGREVTRFDILYGKAVPRPEWAFRLFLAV
jgi:hypothetical protein